MSEKWFRLPFGDILADSKDGEWGIGGAAVSHTACWMIRGTDFAGLNDPATELPLRWIPDHLVNRKRLQPGDVIFEMAGGTATQTTGRSALVRRGFFESHAEHPVLCASFCRHLRVKPEFNSSFVYYLLQALYRAGYMGVFNIQHTGVSRFQYTAFKKKTVLMIPKEPEQDKIAAILSAYDELIETNRRRIGLLEKLAEEIYREWFVRFRFPGHEQVKIVKGVPEGWTLEKLEHAFAYTGGGTPSKEVSRYWDGGEINWFTPTDITGAQGMFLARSASRCTEEGFSSSSAKMFPAYSVMLTSRATIGAVGINTTPACTNQGFITCIPNNRYPLPYLYHWLKLAKPHFESLSVGATFAELTKGTFKRIEILTPPEAIVTAFNDLESPLFEQIETLLSANQYLTRTRDLLLPRLISGKLSVADLDIQFPPGMADEPAAPERPTSRPPAKAGKKARE